MNEIRMRISAAWHCLRGDAVIMNVKVDFNDGPLFEVDGKSLFIYKTVIIEATGPVVKFTGGC